MYKTRILFITLAVLITGCASQAKVESMVPENIESLSPGSGLYQNIYIDSVSGGEETNPLWTSEISSSGFENALREALEAAGALSELRSQAPYRLRVSLDEVKQPFVGFNMEVTTKVTYRMDDPETGQVLLDKQIIESYTAELGEHFLGVERLRLANEGAAKANIDAFIAELKALDVRM